MTQTVYTKSGAEMVGMPDGFQFPEPKLVQQLFAGMQEVVEIGGSWHNPYHCVARIVGRYRNISYDPNGDYRDYDMKFCGRVLPIDIEAEATTLPLDDGSVDGLIASHVIEHIWDPIKALDEWLRVVKDGGLVYLVVPHKDRIRGEDGRGDWLQMPTSESILIARHRGEIPVPADYGNDGWPHVTFWTTATFGEHLRMLQRADWFNRKFVVEAMLNTDDNVGNGFVYVLMRRQA